MSELRAPDPTLTALDAVVEVTTGDRPIAHLSSSSHEHMEWYGHLPLPTRLARWFAVPCRECFPMAPEPGNKPCDLDACAGITDPNLSWQVQP